MRNVVDRSPEPTPIWIIGDSHVSAFAVDAQMIPEFPHIARSAFRGVRACRLGPQLAGTLHLSTSSTGGRQKAFDLIERIPDRSNVFFIFGEIDCRAQIARRADYKDERLEASVADTVTNYMSFITDFHERSKARGLRLGVISPPPTSAVLHPLYGHSALSVLNPMAKTNMGRSALRLGRNFLRRKGFLRQAIGLALNYSGTDAQCLRAGKLFADMLKEHCAALHMTFIDMYHPFLSEAGGIRKSWYWDAVHLQQAAVREISPQFEDAGIFNFAPVREP